MNQGTKTAVKLVFVFGLLYYLAQKGFISFEKTKTAIAKWNYMIPSFLALLATTFVSMLRWHFLLRAQNIHADLNRVMQLQFVGNFFNIALPGVVSGDVVKAVYVAKEIKGQRAHAFSSILFDRVAGVSGLILLSGGALAAGYFVGWSKNLEFALKLFVVTATAGIGFFYIYLFFVKENYDPLLIIFQKLEAKWSFVGHFTRTYEGIRNYHSQRGVVYGALMASAVVHSLVIYSIWNISQALGETHLPMLGIFVLAPLGLLVTAIPIMPAGLGTGHAAFLYLFHIMGSERGADIFTIFILYKLLEGCAGGLVYLRFKSKEPAVSMTETAASN